MKKMLYQERCKNMFFQVSEHLLNCFSMKVEFKYLLPETFSRKKVESVQDKASLNFDHEEKYS